jgi:phospholipid transport system substrate-binding protein
MRQAFGIGLAVGAALVMSLAGGRPAAGGPTDDLRAHVDRVIKALEDPELKKESRTAERRAAIRKIAAGIFDAEESAKRALGPHWAARTPAEREEFVRLFTDLLERSYVSKIELYQGEKIVYGPESVEGGQATVRTRIVTKQGTEIPVTYRLHRRDGRWLVYDVAIEGVSLVANYRTQFNKIIQSSSYEELVKRLRARETPRDGRG